MGDVSVADTGEDDGRGGCTAPDDKAVSLNVGISVIKGVTKGSQNAKGESKSGVRIQKVLHKVTHLCSEYFYEVRHILTHLLKKCVTF